MSTPRPFLSVIVPAHQAAGTLARSLDALRTSDLPRDSWELIVVDDASTDRTALVAAEAADVLVRLSGNPHGPAYARNRGAEVSRGEILVFVDADVCVHADALGRFAASFATRPEVAAIFGSYDAAPPGSGIVSRYRNLLHHYVHQRGAGEAETFWAGCGALRRSVFTTIGQFDEWHYVHPQIEDVELGRRLRAAGHRIMLDPAVRGTHLKRWTLRDVLRTDFLARGVPWMRLMLTEGSAATRTLSVRLTERWCTALVWGALITGIVAVFERSLPALGVALLAFAGMPVLNRGFYSFLLRERGPAFALGVIPLHGLYYLSNGISVFAGWLMHQLFAEPEPPASVAALAQVGVATWPPPHARPKGGTWQEPEPEPRRSPE